MPEPSPRAREERRRAEKLLETSYGWPERTRRRRRRRLLLVCLVLLVLSGLAVVFGREIEIATGRPTWVAIVAFVTAAALFFAAWREDG